MDGDGPDQPRYARPETARRARQRAASQRYRERRKRVILDLFELSKFLLSFLDTDVLGSTVLPLHDPTTIAMHDELMTLTKRLQRVSQVVPASWGCSMASPPDPAAIFPEVHLRDPVGKSSGSAMPQKRARPAEDDAGAAGEGDGAALAGVGEASAESVSPAKRRAMTVGASYRSIASGDAQARAVAAMSGQPFAIRGPFAAPSAAAAAAAASRVPASQDGNQFLQGSHPGGGWGDVASRMGQHRPQALAMLRDAMMAQHAMAAGRGAPSGGWGAWGWRGTAYQPPATGSTPTTTSRQASGGSEGGAMAGPPTTGAESPPPSGGTKQEPEVQQHGGAVASEAEAADVHAEGEAKEQ
eukprot:CAMPEP_0196771156 /NCGR_PEP_ID=MMETSP1104-20130614/1526_1 /TAXON_ID=33652 /ORGANISM="Cafeteria sp., Strain Caron Lab Isolate" /LENGTH=355 /DNA_ID=CAMNT_0042141273 /DNA_START=11 /DNA_END=1078 /DNA_ORIENTATION=-